MHPQNRVASISSLPSLTYVASSSHAPPVLGVAFFLPWVDASDVTLVLFFFVASVRVRAWARVCACARSRVRVRACTCACVRARVCACVANRAWYHIAAKKRKKRTTRTMRKSRGETSGRAQKSPRKANQKKKLVEGTFSPAVFEEREKRRSKP